MPEGDYRFRTEVDEQYFFSDTVNHCTPSTCTSAQLAMPTVHAVTVSVQDDAANPQQDVVVYAFEGATYAEMSYTGNSGKSDALGEVNFELPAGNYWFAYKHGDVAVDAGEAAVCVLPGCTTSTLTAIQSGTTTYVYDPLNRLTGAEEAGVATREYGYTYDAVGNRLTKSIDGMTVNYGYDIANRLTSVDGVTYTWDNNGNLLSDGVFTYTYNVANRLTSATDGVDTYAYAYNASGDRLQQTVNAVSTNYTLDLAAGLTQVLDDGTNVYLYGRDRLAQEDTNGMLYFIPDALGSVRVLADASGDIVDATSYSPYGVSAGMAETSYGFTGEWTDGMGLVNLRARYYAPGDGRFVSRDLWEGNSQLPLSYNSWLYGYDNPIIHVDPSGKCVDIDGDGRCEDTNNREPNTKNYNEKMRPFGITFIPMADPLAIGAKGIPHGKNKAQYEIFGSDPADYYYNACGTTSIAAILAMSSSGVTAKSVLLDFIQKEWGDVFKDKGTGYGELTSYINRDASHSWNATPYSNEKGLGQTGQNKYINNFTFSFSRLILVGVQITGEGKIISSSSAKNRAAAIVAGNDSAICGNGVICHWVVISGKSAEWDSSDSNSPYNWLRVYNPFDNETEYHWWKDFRESMNVIFGKVVTIKDVEAEIINAGLR